MQHALWAGDEVTGATTFRIVKELDAGPTFGVMTERIRATDTAGDLLARLAEGGAGLLVATLDGIEDGTLEARPQPAEGASLRPQDHRRGRPASTGPSPPWRVDRRIRACTPAPGAWTTYDGARVKLGPVTHTDERLEPGGSRVGKAEVLVGTATTAVRLGEVKAFGARQMPAADWARGLRLPAGRPLRFGRAGRGGRVAWAS